MSLRLASLLGLILLFALAQIATFAFKITRNRFYSPFHFAGGFLVATYLLSLYGNYTYAILGTIVVGVLWEVYEYFLWKILKDDRLKQERRDTIYDIVFDFLGGLTAVVIFLLLLN